MTPQHDENSLLGLAGHTAIVVGGGQGMGRASALLFARAGCDVAVVDQVLARAAEVAGEIQKLGRKSVALAGDVTVAEEAERVVDRAAHALSHLDHCVNIVGQASWAPLLELDEATWDRDHCVNLKQHFFVSRAAARQMISRNRPGTLVSVASVSGLFSAPHHASYGAAKAGLMALTRSMSDEWFPHGLRVNSVAPGSVRTPRIMAQQAAGEAPGGGFDERMCEVEDIAGAILFLSSSLARRVTGQTLIVDGGKTALFPWNLTRTR
jgi:NAD(P)-dependent dehydrogenase (short-subunit alcohol dehydrogenase family)